MAEDCTSLFCCDPQDELGLTISAGRVYENEEGTFEVPCPVGMNCETQTITIPAGRKKWQPGPGPTLTLLLCNGETITETVPEGALQPQFDAIVAGMLEQWTEAEANCEGSGGGGGGGGGGGSGGGGGGTTFRNDDVLIDICTEEGATLVNHGIDPPGSMLIIGNGLVVLQGFYSSGLSKEAANQNAFNAGQTWIANALAAGALECSSDHWEYEFVAPGTHGETLASTATATANSLDAVLAFPPERGGSGGPLPNAIFTGGWGGCRYGPYSQPARVYVTIEYDITYNVQTIDYTFLDYPQESCGFELKYGFVDAGDGSSALGTIIPTQHNRKTWVQKFEELCGEWPYGPEFYGGFQWKDWSTNRPTGKAWTATIMKEIPAGEIWDFVWKYQYGDLAEAAFTFTPGTINASHIKLVQVDGVWPAYPGTMHDEPQDGTSLVAGGTKSLSNGVSGSFPGIAGNGASNSHVIQESIPYDPGYSWYTRTYTLAFGSSKTGANPYNGYFCGVVPADEVIPP